MTICPYCNFNMCKGCFYQTLMASTSLEVECVNPECKKEYTRDFIKENFTRVKDTREYLRHQAEILIQREKSLLPASQHYAENIKHLRDNKDYYGRMVREYDNTIFRLKNDYAEAKKELQVEPNKNKAQVKKLTSTHRALIKDLTVKLKKFRRKSTESKLTVVQMLQMALGNELERRLRHRTQEERDQGSDGGYDSASSFENDTKPVVVNQKCSAENCRGFLNNKWVCTMCNTLTCSKCREIIGSHAEQTNEFGEGTSSKPVTKEKHECDPNTVETVKMLKKDTKACPSCLIPIHKIDGCDQMYCVSCYTAFSWNTGKIETGKIHNPHYYQIQRERGIAIPRANDCDQEIIPLDAMFWPTITIFVRNAINIRAKMENQYLHTYNTEHTLQFRVKYLIGDLTEKQWFAHVEKYYKSLQKNRDIHQILDMYIHIIGDYIRTYLDDVNLRKFQENTEVIRRYCNEHLGKIADYYKNVVPRINEHGELK